MVTTGYLKKVSPQPPGQDNCGDHWVFKEGVTTPKTVGTTGYLKKVSPHPAGQNICGDHWVFKEGVTTPSRPEQLW